MPVLSYTDYSSIFTCEYEYKYEYLGVKYEYKYEYLTVKYKYEYEYIKIVLEYYSSTSTSNEYYISAE